MESDPVSKKFKNSGNNCGHRSSDMRHDSLFCLFIEYAWDEHDGEYPGCKDIDLVNWLKAEQLDVNEKLWYCSSKLSIRETPEIELTDNLKSNDGLSETTQDLHKNRMHARLAYVLRNILRILVACNNNVNYANNDGQTLLHLFIEENFKLTQDFSPMEIFRLRKLFKNLTQMKAAFYANDNNGKTPMHIAASCTSIEVLKEILSCLTDVEACDQYGNTALHILVDNCVDDQEADHKAGFVDLIQILMLKGANANTRNKKGITPVHLVAQKFHVDILKIFIDSGADCHRRANDGDTPLDFAWKSTLKLKNVTKILETISLLVSQGCPSEPVKNRQCVLLHYAAEFESAEIIKEFIKLGADVNCRSTDTLLTPLYLAAKGNRLESIKLLVKAGADVNAEAIDGSTALFMAVLWGSYESVQYLIDQGANIYQRDNILGFTLLHMAAYEDKVDEAPNVVRVSDANQADDKQSLRKLDIFIDKDFDVNDSAICGITALHLATIRRNIDNVKILISKGADVNYQNDITDLTALHVATIENNFEMTEILIKSGADVNRKGGLQQMTPLHMVLAVEIRWGLGKYPADLKPYTDISYKKKFWPKLRPNSTVACNRLVKVLLANGADVNAKNTLGKTPLHFTTMSRQYYTMDQLLKSKARVDVQDIDARLPVHNLLKHGSKEQLQLLLDFGSDINDDDTIEMVMNSGEQLKAVIIEHVIKRKLVGLPIAKVYETFVCDPAFANFYKLCMREVTKLINTREAIGFSLYEFLRMNAKRQYIFIEKIESLNNNLEVLFPIYATLIQAVCRYSSHRKTLLESARIAWSTISTVYLPEICLENILSYLNNRYLELLVSSANDNDVTITDEGRKNVLAYSSIRSFKKRK